MFWGSVLVILLLGALYMTIRVEQGVKRRGCGRGCAACGNRAHCHRGQRKEEQ